MGAVTPLEPGTVAVDLDHPRVLRLDMQALADLHRAFGVKKFDPSAVLARFQGEAEPEDFGILLWALARYEDPALTVDRCNRILTMRTLPVFLQAFRDLVAGEQDDDEGGSDDDAGPPAPAASTPA